MINDRSVVKFAQICTNHENDGNIVKLHKLVDFVR